MKKKIGTPLARCAKIVVVSIMSKLKKEPDTFVARGTKNLETFLNKLIKEGLGVVANTLLLKLIILVVVFSQN